MFDFAHCGFCANRRWPARCGTATGNMERKVVLGPTNVATRQTLPAVPCALRYSPTTIPFGVGAMRGKKTADDRT